jgi:DMSO/TMAO reductase YedYZ molybdopterin-dependent catalytic subunit
VTDLLELAGVIPEARYVALSAGEYLICLSLSEVTQGEAILARRLNGESLPEEHGGPCRLIAVGKSCYYSVKWVDRVLALAKQPEETGRAIALGRTRQAREDTSAAGSS